MWARKRLDIGWTDVAAGLWRCVWPATEAQRAGAVERLEAAPAGAGAPAEQAFACFSVRTGFDLVWQALALPPGSEVIFSALTIHDMPRIAAEHGLVPVPADIDFATLGPRREALERAWTPRTRALVVAHLCGVRLDLSDCVAFARKHDLILIEDCAQAYDGPGFTGDARADVSMFSFGTIKTATAMGGAIFQVRRPALRAEMRARQAAYPVVSRSWFLMRLLRNSLMKALSVRPWYGLFVGLLRLCGKDYDQVVNGSVRGFARAGGTGRTGRTGNAAFFERIRRQPSAALLHLLTRRLTQYDTRRLARRTMLGRRLAERLTPTRSCPAAAAAATAGVPQHNFWVFPLLSADPAAEIVHLRKAGFDATQGQSLCAVPLPALPAVAGRENPVPVQAQQFLREVVFLPIYPDLTPAAIDRLAAAVMEFTPVPVTPAPAANAAPREGAPRISASTAPLRV